MRKTQNRRTLHAILHYVKTAHQGGLLKESMMTIAKNTGFSNATVHRALQTLQDEGMVRLIPAESQRDPHTIRYMGPQNDEMEDVLLQAHVAIEELERATGEVKDVMSRLRSLIHLTETHRPEVHTTFTEGLRH